MKGGVVQQRNSTIFVDNLPNGIRKGFVYNLFSRFGRIWDCFIPNKKSRITGQSFGFVRYESNRDAFPAVDATNRAWFWGQELVVNMAKFLKQQDSHPTQFHNRFNQVTLGMREINFKNQRRPRPPVNKGTATEHEKEIVIFQKKQQIHTGYPHLKKRGERGKEVWRRIGVPESSKQGGNRRETIKEDEGKNEGSTINIRADGNGWLNRSAVGKLRRLISIQDLERILKKEKLESVQFKPMGGRYVIITFSSEGMRKEAMQGKCLELWFEEVSPWNGEAAKKERFVWLACYGMPLNAWNVQSFKAIGSTWGCFIEVDNGTLKEVSYAKGRVLIVTENSNKIEGEVQLNVNGTKYCVQVVEEGTFRTISSIEHAANPITEVEDDEVDNTGDDRDANSNKEEYLVDDMERQRKEHSDDKVEEAEKFEEEERVEKSDNGGHKPVLGKEPYVEKSPLQEEIVGDMAQGNNGSDERFYEESSNTVLGLDSIVPDSQSPLNEECFESVNNSSQIQNTEAQDGNEQEQERERVNEEASIHVLYDSNAIVRASQVQSINLHVDLNSRAVRQSIRSQHLEAALSTEEDEIDNYIIASQEQEQISVDKELQNTIIAGNNLGIKFGDDGISRMKKMIEDEAKILKASLKNNSFAPLMRDQ